MGCEAESLTRRSCVVNHVKDKLADSKHSSNYSSLVYCFCGRTMAVLNDPFSIEVRMRI